MMIRLHSTYRYVVGSTIQYSLVCVTESSLLTHVVVSVHYEMLCESRDVPRPHHVIRQVGTILYYFPVYRYALEIFTRIAYTA